MIAAAMPTTISAKEVAVATEISQTDSNTVTSSKPEAPAPGEPDLEARSGTNTRLMLSVDVSVAYSDNIFATRNNEIDDVIMSLRPSAEFVLGNLKSRLTLSGSGELGRYVDNKSEKYNDWQVGFDTRFLLSPDMSVVAGGDYRWDHENRDSPEAVSGIEPTEYERAYGFAGLLFKTQPVTARLVGTVNQFDFADDHSSIGIINNDDRDRTQYELGARVGYKLGTGSEIFVQGAYDKRTYQQSLDDQGYVRFSDGFTVAVGARHQLSKHLSGEVFVGYLQQDYQDARFEDVSTVDFGAALNWRGPGVLSASFQLDRSLEETTLPGASSYMLTSGDLTIKANPHARLSVGLGLRSSHYDYRGADRSESILSSNLWTRYYLNPNLFVETDYTFAERSSNASGFDYDQNRFMFRIGGQLRPHYENRTDPVVIGHPSPGGGYAAFTIGHGTLITGLDGPRGPGSNTADFGDAGLSYGGVVGYGVLINSLYLGVETQGQLAGPDWLHTADRIFSLEQKDSVGISGRIGYADEGDNLAYARAGLTRTNFRTTYAHVAHSFVNSNRMTGLEFGLGVDARVGRQSFIRMEYALTSFGDTDIPIGGGNFDNFSTSRSQFLMGGGIRFGAKPRKDSEVQPTDFAGFYIGAQFGHGSLTSDNFGTRSGGNPIDIQRASQGPAVGVFTGLGIVFSSFYVGGEFDGHISNINWNIERDPSGRIYSAEHEFSFGARARVGYQISDAALLYGHAGAVRTRFNIPFTSNSATVRSVETQTGFRYGAGMEIGVGKNARLRLDYSLTNYRKYEVEVGSSTDKFKHQENVFRIGFAVRL